MSPAVETILMIAKLHPERVELYERIHEQQSETQKNVTKARGYSFIRIYRSGTDIFMWAERAVRARPLTSEEADVIADWHASLADCFSEPWRPFSLIFSFENES